MKKIINNSKLFFSSILLFILNLNIVKAVEYNIQTLNSSTEVSTDHNLATFTSAVLLQCLAVLLILSFAIFIISIPTFIYYKLKNKEQNRKRIKKIILFSFIFSVVLFVVYYILVILASGLLYSEWAY